MSRISQSVREKMATALVKHRFEERGAKLVSESKYFLKAVYEAHYSISVRKHIADIRKSVRDGFYMKNEISVNVNGAQFDVGAERFGTQGVWWTPDCEKLAVLDDLRGYSDRAAFASDHSLADPLLSFASRREALTAEIGEAYKEALGALSQFTTGKRLAADWPEALPIIGDLIPEDDRTLPVVQVAHLNAKFGLPPKTEPV